MVKSVCYWSISNVSWVNSEVSEQKLGQGEVTEQIVQAAIVVDAVVDVIIKACTERTN